MKTKNYYIALSMELPSHYTAGRQTFSSLDVLNHPLEVADIIHRRLPPPEIIAQRNLLRSTLKRELSSLLESVDACELFQLKELVHRLHRDSL